MKRQLLKIRFVKLAAISLVAMVTFTLSNCKKDYKTGNDNLMSAIQKLPEKKLVHLDEVKGWLQSKLLPTQIIDLRLNLAKQNNIAGNHVIKIPIAENAALYFTKQHDSLKVYSYKWESNKLTTGSYKGKLFVLSYLSNTAKILDYSSENVRVRDVQITKLGDTPATLATQQGENLQTTRLGDIPTKLSTVHVLSLKTLIAQVWCWLTGGSWNDGASEGNYGSQGEAGMAGCDYTVDDSNSGGDTGTGGSYTSITIGNPASIGNGIQIGGVSYGGGDLWLDLSQPNPNTEGCGPNGDQFVDPSTGCSILNPWSPYNIDLNAGYDSYDTYDGDDVDDDNDNFTPTGPKSYIPSKITLNNGNTVTVVFGTTNTDHINANQLVDSRLVSALTQALNIVASNNLTIVTIYIEATTNGHHVKVTSNHFKGLALDISRINGVPLIVQGASKYVKALQNAFDCLPNIREKFWPLFQA